MCLCISFLNAHAELVRRVQRSPQPSKTGARSKRANESSDAKKDNAGLLRHHHEQQPQLKNAPSRNASATNKRAAASVIYKGPVIGETYMVLPERGDVDPQEQKRQRFRQQVSTSAPAHIPTLLLTTKKMLWSCKQSVSTCNPQVNVVSRSLLLLAASSKLRRHSTAYGRTR